MGQPRILCLGGQELNLLGRKDLHVLEHVYLGESQETSGIMSSSFLFSVFFCAGLIGHSCSPSKIMEEE